MKSKFKDLVMSIPLSTRKKHAQQEIFETQFPKGYKRGDVLKEQSSTLLSNSTSTAFRINPKYGTPIKFYSDDFEKGYALKFSVVSNEDPKKCFRPDLSKYSQEEIDKILIQLVNLDKILAKNLQTAITQWEIGLERLFNK